MSKYKSKSFYLEFTTDRVVSLEQAKYYSKSDLIYFASQHEYLVYLALRESSFVYAVNFQPTVSIIPRCLGTCFPEGKTWKADFMVQTKDNLTMVVEAKGFLTKDFLLTLALLELNNKKLFDRLWLIFPTSIPKNLTIKQLLQTSMRERILTLRQLRVYLRTKSI